MDPYNYVGGNPETHNDPTGHCWPLCTAIAGAIIGGIIGATVSIVHQASNGGNINWGQVGGSAAIGAAVGALVGAVGPAVLAGGIALAGGASVAAVASVTTIEATAAISVGLSVGSTASVVAEVAGLAAQNASTGPQQAILHRLQSQVNVRYGQDAIKKQNGRTTTNSISEIYDSNGKQIGKRGISDVNKPDPILGDVQCSEGNCIIGARGQFQSGGTYDLYTAQIDGKAACEACREDLQATANTSYVTINAHSIDENGNSATQVYEPQTTDLWWEDILNEW